MEIFDPSVFKLSPNLSWEYVNIGISNIIIIEEFYEDIKAVVREVKKLPAASTYVSDCDISDYRSTFFSASIRGTELPYTKELNTMLWEMINYTGNEVITEDNLLVNVTKLNSDRSSGEYHNIHTDSNKYNSDGDSISTVVFLNDIWHEGEGTSMFDLTYNSHADSLWREKANQPLLKFIQGKENRAIIFSPAIPHCATYGKQFMGEYRYTQAIFTDLN